MNLIAAILILGASVSSEFTGTPSPGHLIADRMGAEYRIEARALSSLADHLPVKGLKEAPLVICIDCMFWHSTDADCKPGLSALKTLFDERQGKPLIIATVPTIWFGQNCIGPINNVIESRCTDHCILVKLEGDLLPPDLHPDEEFMKKVVKHIYNRE